MRVKKNLIKYKDPETGKYIPIPVIAGDSAEEKFELIESFEVTEEIQSFERSEEPDGTHYNFKNIFIHIDSKANPSNTATSNLGVNIGAEGNKWYTYGDIQKGIDTRDVKTWFSLLNHHGLMLPFSGAGQYYSPTPLTSTLIIPKEYKPITNIIITVHNKVVQFGVGTIITILAVRER